MHAILHPDKTPLSVLFPVKKRGWLYPSLSPTCGWTAWNKHPLHLRWGVFPGCSVVVKCRQLLVGQACVAAGKTPDFLCIYAD